MKGVGRKRKEKKLIKYLSNRTTASEKKKIKNLQEEMARISTKQQNGKKSEEKQYTRKLKKVRRETVYQRTMGYIQEKKYQNYWSP